MKYLFILGRNPELSVAEILSYFEKEKNKILSYEVEKNAMLVDFEEPIEIGLIQRLGGTISIGKILCKDDLKELEKIMIYSGTANKLNYVLWNFSNKKDYEKVSMYLKKRFKEERLKATEKKLTAELDLQGGEKTRIASGNIDEEYFIFNDSFGKIVEKTDYKKIENRDMGKPIRRESLAISPRLAKIMINLSGAKKVSKIVDPFCGIGVILQEALLRGMKAVGVDKDPQAIRSAKENLEWFGFDKKNYSLINSDSRKASVGKADFLVSEPDLGKTLTKLTTENQAKKTLKNFEDLTADVLNNMKKYVAKKFVFSAPLIKLQGQKRIGCDINYILKKTGLKLDKGPFKEFRKNQFVGREIFVLKNKD